MRTIARYLVIALTPLVILSSPSHAAMTHVVKKNETLYSLARKYHFTVAELKSANGITSSQVKAGTRLVIPATDHKKDAEPAAAPGTYTVKKGDDLRKIAKKTGVSVFDLKRLNHITRNRVKPGQVLALRDTTPQHDDPPPLAGAARLKLRHPELLKGPDSQAELEEMIGREVDPGIDLTRSGELNPGNVNVLKKAAYSFLGTRYRFGGSTRKGLDCSSFVQQVFREIDITLPRTAREQFQLGELVPFSSLQKGDLVFFRTYAPFPSHVGIYLGNNRMIHASSRDRRVVISTLDTPYYRSRFIGAKRIDRVNPDTLKLDDLLAQAQEELAGAEEENDTLGLSLDTLSQTE